MTAQFIKYEYPLNERIRLFLRLERLFLRISHHLGNDNEYDTQAAITLALELCSFTTRGDLKNEVLKELERQQGTLRTLCNDPYIDTNSLEALLRQLQELQTAVYDSDAKLTTLMRNDEMLATISQRNFVAGGGCDFDLPAYHLWLQQPLASRVAQADVWLSPYAAVRAAIFLCLDVLRQSANSFSAHAVGGFFEYTPDSALPIQMLNICLDAKHNFYPEVSAGRHRFTVRFFNMSTGSARPQQLSGDCEFKLALCGL